LSLPVEQVKKASPYLFLFLHLLI